ncbi:hypothetical protein VPH35_104580 [Triticum aestivum]
MRIWPIPSTRAHPIPSLSHLSRLTSAAPAQTLAPFLLHSHSRRNPPSRSPLPPHLPCQRLPPLHLPLLCRRRPAHPPWTEGVNRKQRWRTSTHACPLPGGRQLEHGSVATAGHHGLAEVFHGEEQVRHFPIRPAQPDAYHEFSTV